MVISKHPHPSTRGGRFRRHDGNIRSASHGVFDDLGNLRRGDRIVIRAKTGRAAYTVTETDEVAR